ncbi:LysR family transcriptional regulator [Falsirhodobacter sp. alg1]|uniref:LysR family transcriptional regulator n=1 Tax=Falsirhodobacter sp. alg1 TaxID=1472418 RepID=UPI000786CCC8|nr:LysR family transcriptional regulator [Falsirhodobacter sp. alg1]
MEIRTLRTFVTVARLKGFSAAARELNTVQPAISRQIHDLEAELGVSLFWRSTRDVRITTAGETLLQEAIEILAHEDRARKLVQRAGQGQIGRLRIGFLSSAAQGFLPAIVRSFSTDFPQVQVSLFEMTAAEQFTALETGQLDIALSRPLPAGAAEHFGSIEIYTDRLFVFLPEGHPLAAQARIAIAALAAHPFVLFQRPGAPGLFDQIITACRRAGFSPEIVAQPNSMQAVLTSVASGIGLSVAPGCIRQLDIKGCVIRPLQADAGSIPFELHHRTDRTEPSTQAFIDLMINSREDIRSRMGL